MTAAETLLVDLRAQASEHGWRFACGSVYVDDDDADALLARLTRYGLARELGVPADDISVTRQAYRTSHGLLVVRAECRRGA